MVDVEQFSEGLGGLGCLGGFRGFRGFRVLVSREGRKGKERGTYFLGLGRREKTVETIRMLVDRDYSGSGCREMKVETIIFFVFTGTIGIHCCSPCWSERQFRGPSEGLMRE